MIIMMIIIINKNSNNSNKMVIIIIIMIIVTIVMIYEFRCNRRSLYHLKTHNQPGPLPRPFIFVLKRCYCNQL